jgi:hypothetical protein
VVDAVFASRGRLDDAAVLVLPAGELLLEAIGSEFDDWLIA